MPKNAFGDEIVVPAGREQEAQLPFMQRFAVAMAQDRESKLATAKKYQPSARMATPEEESPPQNLLAGNPVTPLHGVLYKDVSGKMRQFNPPGDSADTSAYITRSTLTGAGIGIGGALGAGVGIPSGPGAVMSGILGAGGGAVAGDYLANLVGKAAGTEDARSSARMILDKAAVATQGAEAETLGVLGGKGLKLGLGKLASGFQTLKAGAKGLLDAALETGEKVNRGMIFQDAPSIAEAAVAERTSKAADLIKNMPGKLNPDQTGAAIRGAAASKAAFDPTIDQWAGAGPYFAGAKQSYDNQIAQVRGGGPQGRNIDMTNTYNALKTLLKDQMDDPNISKVPPKYMGWFKDLVARKNQLPFDKLRKWHSEMGDEINSSNVKGDTLAPGWDTIFKAQKADLETYATANNTKAALDNANSTWKTMSRTADGVKSLAKAASGREAYELSASDLTPEGLGVIQSISSPQAWTRLIKNIHTALLKKGLGNYLEGLVNLHADSLEMLSPSKLPGGAPNPQRVWIDKAVQAAKDTGQFGMEDAPKRAPSIFQQAAMDVNSATAKWLLGKVSDNPAMLKWYVDGANITPHNTEQAMAFIANIPNNGVRQELTQKLFESSKKPIDSKAKGE